MKLRELLDLCAPDMEIRIIVQKSPDIPYMTVDKVKREYTHLLDREIIKIDYRYILKKGCRPIRTMAVLMAVE